MLQRAWAGDMRAARKAGTEPGGGTDGDGGTELLPAPARAGMTMSSCLVEAQMAVRRLLLRRRRRRRV
jgi:hypothetical protein